jgi:hypothetical protein
MTPVGFEPTISAGKRPHSHALERAGPGTGKETNIMSKLQIALPKLCPSLLPYNKMVYRIQSGRKIYISVFRVSCANCELEL